MKRRYVMSILGLIGLCFTVSAEKSNENGLTSLVGGPPEAPTGLLAMNDNGSIVLKWNKNNELDIAKYYIYGGTTANPTTLIDSTTSANDTVKTITGLTNGILYYFRTSAKNNSNDVSSYSVQDAAVAVTGAGDALMFNGVNSYAQSIAPTVLPQQNITLEGWVKITSYSPWASIIDFYGDEDNDKFSLGFDGNSGEYLAFMFNNSSGAVWMNMVYSETVLPLDEWIHVAVTSDGSMATFYVNGVADGTSAVSPIVSGVGNLFFGVNFAGGDEFFNGQIDEVRMWNVTRTQAEISEAMSVPLRGDESGLIGLWHFDEYSISTAYDATASNQNIALVGAVFMVSGAMNEETVPVELSSFTAQTTDNGVILNWVTASETNNSGWEVERRQNPLNPPLIKGENPENANDLTPPFSKGDGGFSKIGFVSGKGTTTEIQSYRFIADNSQMNSQSYQFRLKQIDTDGNFSYSNILNVNLTPDNFSLSQNYPNPFNPTTVISYQLSAVSNVKLMIFDLLGREVAALVNEEKPAGHYSADFNGRNLTSGLYFYKLTANGQTITKSMMLIK